MADRVVKVTLQAQVANYIAGMEQVRKSTSDTAKASGNLQAQLESQKQAMATVGAGLTAIGALAAVGVGLAIAKFAEFDAAMSNVAAATHESAENMSLLRDAALDAGARTVFSATEAANAIEELGKAGLSTEDILSGGLNAALDLAAAGGLGVADAAGIAATALKVFKLEGKDMGHVADVLAAGAGKAMGDVTDLAAALSQSGMVAKSTGLSIDETTGSLAAFASQGLLGSDAGTSFKTMLGALTPNSAAAKAEMDKLGISAYDAQGKFVGMEKFAGNLQTSLSGLTDEQRSASLEIMFGSDAVRAATVLYSEGEKGIADWNDKVNDSGYAAETARMRLDNLKGDVEALGGAFDTALIKSGSNADGALRMLAQTGTQLIDVFNSAPPVVQNAALMLGVVTAAAGLAGGAFLLGVPKIAEFSLALATLSSSTIPGVAAAAVKGQAAVAGMSAGMGKAAAFMTGPWGLALAAAAVGVAVLSSALDKFYATSEEMGNSLATSASAVDLWATATKGGVADWATSSVDSLENFKVHLDDVREMQENWFATLAHGADGTFDFQQAIGRMGDGLAEMAATDLPGAQKAFGDFVASQKLSDEQAMVMLNAMPKYKDALVAQAKELDINVTSTDDAANATALLTLAQEQAAPTALTAAEAYLKTADEANGLDDQVRALIDSISAANGVGQDAISTNASYQAALAGITAELDTQRAAYEEANGTLDGFTFSLDESTVAGSANAEMLAGVAQKAQDAALAQYEVDKTTMGAKEATDKYVGTLAGSRQALIDQAIANGATADEVQKLADKVYALPTQKQIEILARTAQAASDIDSFVNAASGKRIRIGVDMYGGTTYQAGPGGIKFNAQGSVMDFYANGGMRENHVAQIAPAGSWRVWGEPETGGESYIPLAPSKRARSLEIWQETGSRLGVTGFAGGGFMSGRDVQYASSGFGSGGSTTTHGDTFQATFQLAPLPGRSLADQAFEASRRMKIRR